MMLALVGKEFVSKIVFYCINFFIFMLVKSLSATVYSNENDSSYIVINITNFVIEQLLSVIIELSTRSIPLSCKVHQGQKWSTFFFQRNIHDLIELAMLIPNMTFLTFLEHVLDEKSLKY